MMIIKIELALQPRAKMRIKDDLTYDDLGLVQPEGGSEIGEKVDHLVISENSQP